MRIATNGLTSNTARVHNPPMKLQHVFPNDPDGINRGWALWDDTPCRPRVFRSIVIKEADRADLIRRWAAVRPGEIIILPPDAYFL